ncbi:MAG TPA: OmpH family outer membrane protein [Caulobacteraceae bacterium]
MHKIHLIISAATTAALVAASGVAMAQPGRASATAPSAAAAPAVPMGPPVANMCIFSNQGAIAQSAVGKYVVSRLQQIQAQVQAELQAEDTPLQADIKAYGTQRASLSSEVQQQRERALSDRIQAARQKGDLRNRELQATQQKALSRIVSEYNPIVLTVMHSHNCGVVVDGQSTLAFNPAMDLTPDVVRQLDGKITQFPFEREHLDAGAAPAAAGQR